VKVLSYYVESWRRYADFQGRSSRAAYWSTLLISVVVTLVLGGVSAAIWDVDSDQLGPLEGIYTLAFIIPSLALSVRRLHDIGRSGKWMWILLTGIGGLVLLWWHCLPSSPEDNQWGPAQDRAVGDQLTPSRRRGGGEPKQPQGPADIIR
tara:strand:- start:283 stop:732 length:450 start_codon:yes stop_codon:yes gene_type:complete